MKLIKKVTIAVIAIIVMTGFIMYIPDKMNMVSASGINYYTITATAGEHGSISPSGSVSVAENSDQDFMIIPDCGYIPYALTDGISSTLSYGHTFFNVCENHSIAASFIPDPDAVAEPLADLASGTYTGAQIVTLSCATSESKIYYTTDGTISAESSVLYTGPITVNDDMTIKAIGRKSGKPDSIIAVFNYTINHPAVNSVSVTPNSASVKKGSTQAFTASVDAVYGAAATVTWAVSGNTSSATKIDTAGVLTVGSDESASSLEVTATSTVDNTKSGTATVTVESPATYTITASAGNYGHISPGSTVTVMEGSSQTFTITPDCFYNVSDVTVDGVSCGAMESYTFSNITGNHQITATFAQDPIVAPTASLQSGCYEGTQSITLSTPTKNADIYYTHNKREWFDYTGPIIISSSTRIYAKTIVTGGNRSIDSDIQEYNYVIYDIPSANVAVDTSKSTKNTTSLDKSVTDTVTVASADISRSANSVSNVGVIANAGNIAKAAGTIGDAGAVTSTTQSALGTVTESRDIPSNERDGVLWMGLTSSKDWDIVTKKMIETTCSKIEISMGGTETVTKEVFEAIKGKDIEVTFNLWNGASWTVNGKDIKDVKLKDINIGVSYKTKLEKIALGNKTLQSTVQITLFENGSFGFPMTFNIRLDSILAGEYATLIYKNGSNNEKVDNVQIADDGIASFTLLHASEYAIVITDKELNLDSSSSDGNTNQVKNPVYLYVIGAVTTVAVIGGGTAFAAIKRKGKNKEQ